MQKFFALCLMVAMLAGMFVPAAFAEVTYEAIELPYGSQWGEHQFYDGYAPLYLGDGWTYIDIDGNMVDWDLKDYTTCYDFSEGLAAVSNGENIGYIDTKGNLVIDFLFDERANMGALSAGRFVDGKTIAFKNISGKNQYGMFNSNDWDAFEIYYINTAGEIIGTVGEDDDISMYLQFDHGGPYTERTVTFELLGQTFEDFRMDGAGVLYYDFDAEKLYIIRETGSGSEPAVPEKPSNPVASTPSSWAAAEVEKAEGYGLTSGLYFMSDISGNFYQNSITREEFATVIVDCIANLGVGIFAPLEEGEEYIELEEDITFLELYGIEFADTYNENVYLAYDMGIVKGVGENMFAPERNITRQEIAVMMDRAIRYVEQETDALYVETNESLEGFSDADFVADWAKASVGTLAASDIMKGTSETTLSPLNNTTREQALLLAVRIFELMQ